MNASQKVAQYLGEARASEDALVRVLQSQIAMTPTGSYRSALQAHLDQTRQHSSRIGRRLSRLDGGASPLQAIVGFTEDVIGQALALGKTPVDLLRGSSGEEKVLKNAKDAAATEALEIATYTAIERLARSVGDDETAELAASIRDDEEQMLARIIAEIPQLTDAVSRSELKDDPSYDVSKTGAADAVRDVGSRASSTARTAGAATRRTARRARKVPGVARAEGRLKGVVAEEQDLGIAGYDGLTVDEITKKLANLSQIDLARIDVYERGHQNRTTIHSRIEALRGDEPWPGYDELKATEVQSALSEGDRERTEQIRAYERSHKNRAGVLKAADRELANR